MRWTIVARIVVAAVGLGCAAAIVVYTRNRPQAPKPQTSLEKIDPNSLSQGGAGRLVFLRGGGRSPITVTYSAAASYADGRSRYEKATVEGLEDTRFTISADVLEAQGKSNAKDYAARYDLTGHVTLVTDDGLRLETETASYDAATSRLAIPGHVTFKKGRLSGSGVGAAYDRDLDVFTILDQASARVQPDATGKGSADATSTRMSLVRGQHMLRLDGSAKIIGEGQTLTGNEATVLFKEDESAIKFLELRGAARVTPHAGAAADRAAMSADNVTMAFLEDGITLQHATLTGRAVLTLGGPATQSIRASWIDLFVGPDGHTLTRLQARDRVVVDLPATATTAGRKITATVLSTTGDEKRGLTSARFEGNPRFEELAAAGPRRGGVATTTPARSGSGTTLVLMLGGKLEAIERADFLQNAEFKDGTVTAYADEARYDQAKGTLKLTANLREPRRACSLVRADLTVGATTSIDVDMTTENLTAQGHVTTRMTQAAGKAATPGALFDGEGPIIGGAQTFVYVKATGKATYTGAAGWPASLLQGQTSVTARVLVFTETSRDLNANDAVVSVWALVPPGDAKPAAAGGAPPALQSYRVEAETLQYVDARRTAVYNGTAVLLKTADVEIESRRLTFQLAAASRTLESMHAERLSGPWVFAKLPGGYEGLGDDLVYRAGDEVYTLRGESAWAKAPKNRSGTGSAASAGTPDCTRQESLVFEFNSRTGEWRIPGRGEAPRTVIDMNCSVDLRHIKK